MRMADRHLVDKCLNGDSAAFGMLVDRYKESVYALAYSRIRNFHDAEDVTQEAFTKAYQKLRTLRRWDEFHVWIYAITSNLCKDWIRAESRRPDREFIADHSLRSLSRYSGNFRNDDDMLEVLHEAMDSLPESYQQVLTLHYLGGMDGTEIAEFLGMSPSAIWQRLSRARASLKKEILDMMSETYERNRLRSGFTFRVLEMVKRIRIDPVPPRVLPWGISIAGTIIIGILGIGSHLNPASNEVLELISLSAGESRVLKIGEFPVDMVKASEIPVIRQFDGNGLGSVAPGLQNALFMAPQAEGETWTRKADMPTARERLATCLMDGKIYAFGGFDHGIILSTVEEYDLASNSWTRKAGMPTARQGLSASAVEGRIYAIGGGDPAEFSTVEEYDPINNKWSMKADMPTKRQLFSTCTMDRKIYAIGGWQAGTAVPAVEEYDPVEDRWTKKSSMSTPKFALSTSVVNGKIYVIGGIAPGVKTEWLPTVEEYDPDADTWTTKTDAPIPLYYHSACVIESKIYVLTGKPVYVYDPAVDEWTEKAVMQTNPRHRFSAQSVGGKIYVIGGSDGGNALSTVEEYNTVSIGESINLKGKLPTTWGDVRTVMKK